MALLSIHQPQKSPHPRKSIFIPHVLTPMPRAIPTLNDRFTKSNINFMPPRVVSVYKPIEKLNNNPLMH